MVETGMRIMLGNKSEQLTVTVYMFTFRICATTTCTKLSA